MSNVGEYRCYDIYSADSIRDLIKYRKYCLCDLAGLEPIDLEVQEVIELLENIVRLLLRYDNYQMAFLREREERESMGQSSYYCLVKERQGVFLRVFDFSEGKAGVCLSITEPMVVKAFEEYFKDIWERIAPVNKNKGEIIHWLQSQINLLKQ